MISCKDFIPAYSEFFKFLASKKGAEEVNRYWGIHFDPKNRTTPLAKIVEKEGIKGCFTYWTGTLNEEAADFTMYLNEKRGFYLLSMHRCPSKGRLLELQNSQGLEPYEEYCFHCDFYRHSIEPFGLKYLYNFQGIDKAACSILVYDPKVFDGRVIIDEDTVIMDRRASQNEYFHQDFHKSMNRCIDYLGETYKEAAVREYAKQYVENVLHPTVAKIKKEGLCALREFIFQSYEKEKAPKAVSFEETNSALSVTVTFCPVVSYLRENDAIVSPWYPVFCNFVMEEIGKACELKVKFGAYDEKTGATAYQFVKE